MLTGLFLKDHETIAESLSSSESSLEGIVAGVRLINFYLNHAAKGLSASRRRSLEKAQKLLSARLDQAFRERERELQRIAIDRKVGRAPLIEIHARPSFEKS
jgi:hypothetical protein